MVRFHINEGGHNILHCNNIIETHAKCRYMFRTDTEKYMIRHNKMITKLSIEMEINKNYSEILLNRKVLIGRSVFKCILMKHGYFFMYACKTNKHLAPSLLLYIPNKPFPFYKLYVSQKVISKYSTYTI